MVLQFRNPRVVEPRCVVSGSLEEFARMEFEPLNQRSDRVEAFTSRETMCSAFQFSNFVCVPKTNLVYAADLCNVLRLIFLWSMCLF